MTSTLSFMTKKARQKTGDNFSQFVSSQVQIVIGAFMGINHAHQTMASCEQHSLIFAQGVALIPQPRVLIGIFSMKTEKLHEGWRALWLAIAGVMVVMLIWNVVMLSLNGISY